MHRLRHYLAALILLPASAATSAHAQQVEIDEISKPGRNIVHFLRRGAGAPVSGTDAERIKKGILSDTKVDAGERKLLDALLNGQTVLLRKEYDIGEDYTMSRELSDEARAIFSSIESFEHDDPLYQKWVEASQESMGELLVLWNSGGESKQSVYDMLYVRLEEVWAKSRYEDDYSTMKGELSSWQNRCWRSDGAQSRACLNMAYEVIRDLDDTGLGGAGTVGGIPDFLYMGFKPD